MTSMSPLSRFRQRSRRRPAVLVTALLVAASAQPTALVAADRDNAAGLELFEKRVRPILVDHCFQCHGPSKQESSLRLDRRDWVLQGGDTGPALTPGKPEASLVIAAVKHEGPEMPPDGKLSDEDISALEQWVRLGAPWPKEADTSSGGPALGDQVAIREVAKDHWAFQPVVKAELPAVSHAEWVRTPVDAFILAKLDAAGLRPSPPADRRSLLRRIMFDLVGLPPTAEEIDAFVNDHSPDAYRHVVERLLDSPQYGERWARHWLDIARYADTREWQAQKDSRYPYAYTYRDYVIKAFNNDLPYDQFIREQIAADAYTDDPHSPALAAMGFLTVGPRYRNAGPEQIADRIDVVTRGLLGLTVACARCHDHKYDPIPIKDYYSLYGVFGSIDVPEDLPLITTNPPPADLVADYEKQRAEKVQELEAYQKKLQADAHEHLKTKYADYLAAYYEMNISREDTVRELISGGNLIETVVTPLGDTLDRVKTQAKYKRDPIFAPWAALIGEADDGFSAKVEEYLASLPEGGNPRNRVNPLVRQALASASPANRKEMLTAYGKLFQQAADASGGPADPALTEIREMLASTEGPFYFTPEACTKASQLLGAARVALGKLTTAIQEVDVTHPGAPPRAMIVADAEQPLEPVVFLRGDPSRRGDKVPRRFLSIIAGDNAPAFTTGSGRKDLAEAIADPHNPLTPRVIVDQVWMHHFGAGLAKSQGDFGLRSDPPSHPELLDWLASTFVEHGWSLKQLHRLIVLSNAYQQASDYLPLSDQSVDPRSIDSENRLLWRFNRRRLDFESMRDAMLSAAGRIDLTVGGRSVSLTAQPFTTRRSLYGYIDRVNLDPLLSTFDFASPDAPATKRPETLVPQQALFAMNHPFVIEQARMVSALTAGSGKDTDDDRADRLYRRIFGRAPSLSELADMREFVHSADGATRASQDPWEYGYGPVDRSGSAEDQFMPLAYWTGNAYQVGAEYPDPKLAHLKLTSTTGHPGRNGQYAIIRRWTAPADLTISISGKIKHDRDKGDGVEARIVAGRGGVLGVWPAFNNEVATNVESYAVAKGETIDFLVDCRQNAANDIHLWAPVITSVSPTQQTWDAAGDFRAPPPPLLTAWEQAAQALLLTNEFLYVD